MKISELVKELERLKELHGDIDVKTQTMSHVWDPDPVVRGEGAHRFVLVNP